MHVNGRIREIFAGCVAAWDGETEWWAPLNDVNPSSFADRKFQQNWTQMNKEDRARWLIGQLWNCTDVCPHEVADSLDIPGGTFASIVRHLAMTDPPDAFIDLIRSVQKKRQEGQKILVPS